MRDTERGTLTDLVKAAADVAGQTELDDLLRTTVRLAREATGSRYAAMGVLGSQGTLRDFIHQGMDADLAERIGHLPVGHGVLGTLIRNPHTVRVDDISQHPDSVGFPEHHPTMTTFLGVPVRAGDSVFGNLYLTDKDEPYTADDETLVEALAAIAGGAISSLRLRQRLSDLALAEDRERIARDLHDAVIQDLFAVGLGLQAATAQLQDEALRRRMDDAVDRIDTAIASLRTFIFDLRSLGTLNTTLARTLDDMLGRIAGGRATWQVGLSSDVGQVDSNLLDNALLVAREAVSNAIRHGAATEIGITIERIDGGARLVVTDNGVGFDPTRVSRGMGLTNMEARATDDGGEFSVESSPGGTTVRATFRRRRR
ncbi:MAG TPA: GAF domain-containing sensor histidine kinase [Acidimicrobiia bacterium]|nr:GAF domain-containing sensor histidine kinase [Acidimicrobiia bacterium]